MKTNKKSNSFTRKFFGLYRMENVCGNWCSDLIATTTGEKHIEVIYVRPGITGTTLRFVVDVQLSCCKPKLSLKLRLKIIQKIS